MVLAYFPQRMKRSLTTNSNYPPQGLISNGAVGALEMEFESDWFDLDFQKRIPLTINVGQVPTTQNDFPLLINDIYPDLIGEVEAEIRFAGSDNIQLEYEIQKFDNSTGELIAWTKKPTVDDGDFIAIYFDNPGATDEQNPPAVYDVNYKYVGHLQNNADDSTSNGQDLTNFGSALTPVSAKIGDGQFYNGTTSDFSRRNPFTGWPTTEITCEFWLQTTGNGDGMVSYAVGTGALANHFFIFNQVSVQIFITSTADAATGVGFDDGVFHHMVVTWRSSDGQLILYKDGVIVSSAIHKTGTSFIVNGSLVLGQDQDNVGGGFSGVMAYDGILDELRLSNNVRSADNILTSFNNQDNPGTFYTTGAVESAPTSIPEGVMDFETLGTMEFET